MVTCSRCGWQVYAAPDKVVRKANGVVLARWTCDGCGAWFERGVSADTPLTRDHLGKTPPCARCGAPEAELHHWAPRARFSDADDWPTSYLCPPCHRAWHAVMTPP